jgi:hypothetical protein
MGPKDFQDMVDNADGGVLFIDEAHAIMDGDPKSAKAIITIMLTAAENKREALTIILAGYKDEIETKLYASDQGFKSRFRQVLALPRYDLFGVAFASTCTFECSLLKLPRDSSSSGWGWATG